MLLQTCYHLFDEHLEQVIRIEIPDQDEPQVAGEQVFEHAQNWRDADAACYEQDGVVVVVLRINDQFSLRPVQEDLSFCVLVRCGELQQLLGPSSRAFDLQCDSLVFLAGSNRYRVPVQSADFWNIDKNILPCLELKFFTIQRDFGQSSD